MRDASEVHTCSYYCERPDCVRRQRDELRDALPAAADDPCVRHACKRVRMEMQARIDALSEVLLTDAQCDRIIDSLDSLAQDVCQYEYGLPVYDHMPAMRAAIRAAIKGDGHAG